MTGINLADALKDLADKDKDADGAKEDPLDQQLAQLKQLLRAYFKACGKEKRLAKLALIHALYPETYTQTPAHKPPYLDYFHYFQDSLTVNQLEWFRGKFKDTERGMHFIHNAARQQYAALILDGFNRFHEGMLAYDRFKSNLASKLVNKIKSRIKLKPEKFEWFNKIYQHEAVQHHLLPYLSQIIVAIIIGLNLGSGFGQSLGIMSTLYYIWGSISTAHHKTEHHTGPSITGYLKEKAAAWGHAFISMPIQEIEDNNKSYILKIRRTLSTISTPIMTNLNLFSYPLRLTTSIAAVAWYYSGITIPIPFVSGSVDSSTMSMLLLAYSLGFKNLPGYLIKTKPVQILNCKINRMAKSFFRYYLKS